MPLGLSGGASTRIANELGGSCPEAAKQAADVAVWMTLVLQILVAVGMYVGRYAIGYAFTDSPLVWFSMSCCCHTSIPMCHCTLLLYMQISCTSSAMPSPTACAHPKHPAYPLAYLYRWWTGARL